MSKLLNFFILTGLVISFNIRAAVFCVSDVVELRNAIDVAQSNLEDDEIKLKGGVFQTNGTTFSYYETSGYDLTISGGWDDMFFLDDCEWGTDDPLATVLDGSNNSQILYIQTSNNASIEVSGITFRNAITENRGGGLYISKSDNLQTGTITIQRNVFINNEGSFGSAFSVSGADTFHIRNNLILGNNALIQHAVTVVSTNGNGIYFNNNTVMGNTSDDPSESGAVYLSTSGTSNLLVANNILNGNQLEDLFGRNSSTEAMYYIFNNNLDVLVGHVPDVYTGNFNLPNRFESGFLNFTPDANSPLVDAGKSPCGLFCPVPTPFVNDWELGSGDLLRRSRVQSEAVDIGAFESNNPRDLIFWNQFDKF